MRAVRRTESGIEVADVDEPRGDGVLVSVDAAGICGSDIHMLEMGPSPITMGHEFGGRLADGTLVAVRPTGMCGTCRMCTTGRSNICPESMARFFGGVLHGGFADRVLVDPNCVFPMPPGATSGAAALVEPLAVAVHGVRRVAIEPGSRVAVIGAGSVGLAVVAALRHLGVEAEVEARYDHQRDAVEALGGSVGISGRYDVVFDAVGSQSAVDVAVRACETGGSIVELGVFWDAVSLRRDVTLREISLIPAVFYAHGHDDSDFATAIDILSASPQIEDILVTHRFSLDDAR
ncbi:MAG: hypothetical protein RL391_71, partial [Actinomycetota bacterium]